MSTRQDLPEDDRFTRQRSCRVSVLSTYGPCFPKPFPRSPRALLYAQRLRARGKIGDPEGFVKELNLACDVLKVPRIYVGRFRHRHMTDAEDEGIDRKVIREGVHHKSDRMTEIYTETAVPKRFPTPV